MHCESDSLGLVTRLVSLAVRRGPSTVRRGPPAVRRGPPTVRPRSARGPPRAGRRRAAQRSTRLGQLGLVASAPRRGGAARAATHEARREWSWTNLRALWQQPPNLDGDERDPPRLPWQRPSFRLPWQRSFTTANVEAELSTTESAVGNRVLERWASVLGLGREVPAVSRFSFRDRRAAAETDTSLA